MHAAARALSVRQITGQPILFMGTGEKTEALEVVQAERVASRILGMGDVLALVENVTRNVDREQAEKLARKLKKGKDFDLEDLHDQLQQVEKMGGLSALMDKLPAQLAGRAAAAPQANDKEIKRQIAVIRSMTPGERRYPKNIDASRKRRIAAGSGVHVSEVNRLLKNYLQMQKMMKTMSKGGGLRRLMGIRRRTVSRPASRQKSRLLPALSKGPWPLSTRKQLGAQVLACRLIFSNIRALLPGGASRSAFPRLLQQWSRSGSPAAGRRSSPSITSSSRTAVSARAETTLEQVGYFNPVPAGKQRRLELNLDRIDYWVGKGAKPSDASPSWSRSIASRLSLRPELVVGRRVVLGQVVWAFGVQGWVRIQSHTDPPANILKFGRWQLGRAGQWREVEVEDGKVTAKGVLAKLVGVETPEEARLATGSEIAVARAKSCLRRRPVSTTGAISKDWQRSVTTARRWDASRNSGRRRRVR
jgi:ribosomal protein S16